MTTVGIIGAGDLGGSIAESLAAGERVSRIVLIDAEEQAAAGKALDLQQAGAIAGAHTRLIGTGDLSRVAGCAVCVVADRFGARSPDWRGDDARGMLEGVARFAPRAPFVFAGAAHTGLMLAAARHHGVDRNRLIGSVPEALSAALRAIVALEAHCAPADVTLAVLGTPPDFIVPWTEVSIGGYALHHVLTQAERARMEARAARLWPPGPRTLALAAARMVEAILTSSRSSFSVLTVLSGEFGVRDQAGTLPAVLSPYGIVRTRVPALETRERVQLETALQRGAHSVR